MKLFFTSLITTLFIAFMFWFLISWVNVICHNGPYEDGDPASWNAFVVLTEVAR